MGRTLSETAMVLKLTPELELALARSARQKGINPDLLAISILREHLLQPPSAILPHDAWERLVQSAASDCGVSLPDSAFSSDSLYD
jgi:hypothetical protein